MASVRKLSDLFRALSSHDLRSATTFASRIADDEEQLGHRSAAAMLRGALQSRGRAIQLSTPPLDIATALIGERPGPPLDQVVLTDSARRELLNVCIEWQYRHDLERQGLSRRTKLVFSGPPGCGKTLTARSLGTELRLPVLTVRFSTLVGAYLGQTGANLRAVFAFAETTPCILLLDEFDAIARMRGRMSDVGELDRIVISLLQELDHTIPNGIVIAATNIPESLDRAIWRRFDEHIEFPLPARQTLQRFTSQRLLALGAKRAARVPAVVKSFADAEKWALQHHREHTLEMLRREYGEKKRT